MVQVEDVTIPNEELPEPTLPAPAGEEAPSQLIRHAVVLQLKLLLEGMKDLLLGPVALAALAVDLLVRRKRDGRLFYDTLRGGARFEDFLNLYGALPERRDSDDVEVGTTIDRFINRAEEDVLHSLEKELELQDHRVSDELGGSLLAGGRGQSRLGKLLVRGRHVFDLYHARASSSRSFPQKSSRPTTNVGAPKIPSPIAASVCRRRRSLFSGPCARSIIDTGS